MNYSLKLTDLIYQEEDRERVAFHCSDYKKLAFDIFHSFKKTAKTNPPEWFETLKWGAGKGVELAMLDILKQNGIVDKTYDQKLDGRIDFVREGVEIHGYMDAKVKSGNTLGLVENAPIEIKSINNANKFDIEKYINNNPRENYVGQLAMYMDCLDMKIGYLFVASIDGLSRFSFICEKIDEGIYKCGNTIVDLNKEYKRFSDLKTNYIDKNIEPNSSDEAIYKYDLSKLDFQKEFLEGRLFASQILKARNNEAVIGDWQVKYSDYKDLIIKQQNTSLGYTDEEIKLIKEKTVGYTTWKK